MKPSLIDLRRIVQHASHAGSPEEQTQRIVDSVSAVIGSDICSLYATADDGSLVLLASHGLQISQPIVIPEGKGLVGLIARSRHPLNIANAALHPDYHFVAGSEEERFPGFCGVPVVSKGACVGVLVVQSQQENRLSPLHEAFIETLAAHLALMLGNLNSSRLTQAVDGVRLVGVSGSPGIAVGSAKPANPAQLSNVAIEYCQNVEMEISSWEALLAATSDDLAIEMQSLTGRANADATSIFDSYSMLLNDEVFIGRVRKEIRQGYQVPAALKLSIAYFADMFEAMDDPYIRARHEDIRHLGNKLYRKWLGGRGNQIIDVSIDEKVVLIGEALSVSDIANLPAGQLVGIVCFDGSSLSHIAILANALGIPAVMGIGVLKDLQPNEMLIVDGDSSLLIRRPDPAIINEYRELIESRQELEASLKNLRLLPARTTDAAVVRLLANTGLQEDLLPGLANGAEGIGLYRTEIPFMVRQNLPSEDEQVEVYSKVFDAYPNKPVYIRTLDVGADKPLSYLPVHAEDNPALGLRGIRFTLDNVQLLMTQIRAILRAGRSNPNIHVLIPMVSATSELDQVLDVVDEAMSQLKSEGQPVHKPKIGVMVEVPAAISLLPFWEHKIDFVSIGTNDLSQYILALDRNNPLVAKLYESVHPSVLQEIKRIVDWSQEAQIPLSVCGEMASDPVSVLLLLGMGVRTLSMSSSKIPLIKSLIRGVSMQDANRLLETSMAFDNPESIRTAGNQMLNDSSFQWTNERFERGIR